MNVRRAIKASAAADTDLDFDARAGEQRCRHGRTHALGGTLPPSLPNLLPVIPPIHGAGGEFA